MWQIETKKVIQQINSSEFHSLEFEQIVQNKLKSILAECCAQNEKLTMTSQQIKSLQLFEQLIQEQKNIEYTLNNLLQNKIIKEKKNQINEEIFVSHDETQLIKK